MSAAPEASASTGPPPEEDLGRAYVRMTLVLRVGLGVALAVFAGSLIALVVQQPDASSADLLAATPLAGYFGLGGLVRGLEAGSAVAYLTIGVLALVATPVTRVITGIYYFRATGRRALAKISSIVLTLLLVSLFVVGPLLR